MSEATVGLSVLTLLFIWLVGILIGILWILFPVVMIYQISRLNREVRRLSELCTRASARSHQTATRTNELIEWFGTQPTRPANDDEPVT